MVQRIKRKRCKHTNVRYYNEGYVEKNGILYCSSNRECLDCGSTHKKRPESERWVKLP